MNVKNYEHTARQLDTRGLPYTYENLIAIASKFAESTAVILGKVRSAENPRYVDKIVLIVRNQEPITIMTRRESQSFDARSFDVKKIVYL